MKQPWAMSWGNYGILIFKKHNESGQRPAISRRNRILTIRADSSSQAVFRLGCTRIFSGFGARRLRRFNVVLQIGARSSVNAAPRSEPRRPRDGCVSEEQVQLRLLSPMKRRLAATSAAVHFSSAREQPSPPYRNVCVKHEAIGSARDPQFAQQTGRGVDSGS